MMWITAFFLAGCRVAAMPAPDGIVALAAGAGNSCVLRADGSVWCWGGATSGRLGGAFTPGQPDAVRVEGLTGPTAITAGNWHACA